MSAGKFWRHWHHDRNTSIVAAADQGVPLGEIAEQHSLTRARIRDILMIAGRSLQPLADDPLYPERAMKVAAELGGANVAQMLLDWRKPRQLVHARWACMAAMRKRGLAYPQIGRRMQRDHSTIIYGCKQAEYFAARSPEFAEMLAQVEAA